MGVGGELLHRGGRGILCVCVCVYEGESCVLMEFVGVDVEIYAYIHTHVDVDVCRHTHIHTHTDIPCHVANLFFIRLTATICPVPLCCALRTQPKVPSPQLARGV